MVGLFSNVIITNKRCENYEKDKDFLGTEPIGKLLLRLAIPTLAAQLINMLYNVVDRIYIGHIPKVGALALTGVGVCMPLIMIVSAFAVLVGNGGARELLFTWDRIIRKMRRRHLVTASQHRFWWQSC